jgi:drug/metabolite transporter (DMT)-like permease
MVAVTLCWSTAGVITRQLETAKSFEITFWRSAFTAASLFIALSYFHGMQLYRQIFKNPSSFWISGVCWSVMFTAFMMALTLTSVANVLVTMSMGPLLTALIARIFMGHRVPLRTWIAICVAGSGVVYMYATQLSQESLSGTWVALCVPFAAATNWTIAQNAHDKGHDIDLVPAVMVGAVISALLTLPLAYPFQANAHDMAWLGFLGVGQLALPCVLSVWCTRVLKAPELSLLQLLEVVFGILLAWLGANEVPGDAVILGGLCVIGALVANELQGWRNRI